MKFLLFGIFCIFSTSQHLRLKCSVFVKNVEKNIQLLLIASICIAAEPRRASSEFEGRDDETSSTSSEKYERDVTVLNHCFDDIEKFIARLQHAAAASRELERRQKQVPLVESTSVRLCVTREPQSTRLNAFTSYLQDQEVEEERLGRWYADHACKTASGNRVYRRFPKIQTLVQFISTYLEFTLQLGIFSHRTEGNSRLRCGVAPSVLYDTLSYLKVELLNLISTIWLNYSKGFPGNSCRVL